jgi:hypothetical protein
MRSDGHGASYVSMGHRKTLSIALGAAAFTGMVMTTAILAPSGNAGTTTNAAAGCGRLFDDFVYTSSADAALAQRGWTVRGGGGGPGVDGNTWSPSNVDFPGTGSAKTARMRATTNGTPSGTVNSELYQRRKFTEGTYSARIRFTNTPIAGADGDPVVQTFFTITPLDFPNDPDYGEADFEYLPNGGWGGRQPTMHNTTYETYQPDPWQADNLTTPTVRDLNGWHDYTLQIGDGTVRYLIDGVTVAEHGGHVYPETAMSINFNIWFIDLNAHTGAASTYEQEIDYLYYTDREVVGAAEVASRVEALRAAGTAHTDTVGTGTCTSAAPSSAAPASPSAAAPACSDAAAWSADSRYRTGSTVTHGGHLWRSTRTTRGNEPGVSTRWTDLGVCAAR